MAYLTVHFYACDSSCQCVPRGRYSLPADEVPRLTMLGKVIKRVDFILKTNALFRTGWEVVLRRFKVEKSAFVFVHLFEVNPEIIV